MRTTDWNDWDTFCTVATLGSFTRAAEQLCVTQGAVSRQIQTLEAHYGFPLVKRHAKGLTLTAEVEVTPDSFTTRPAS